MSEQPSTQKPVDDEIDLSLLFKAIKNFFKNILKGFLNIFIFFYKHKFYLLGIIVLGVVLGYIYEKNAEKIYINDLLVSPNFSITDYVYTKIDVLDKKMQVQDTLFLKNIFGENYEQIKSIEIKPVIDINNLISQYGANEDFF